jgi:transposase
VLDEVRALERAIRRVDDQLEAAVRATGTGLLKLHGVGTVVAATLLGHIGDIRRFPTAGHFAAHCGVAPLEAASGDVVRHRLSPLGDRQLNAALYVMAVTQASSHPLGRAYDQRKQAEGHSKAEALRCLKRRLADVVYRCLRRETDAHDARAADGQARPPEAPPPAWQRTKNARRGLHRGAGTSSKTTSTPAPRQRGESSSP